MTRLPRTVLLSVACALLCALAIPVAMGQAPQPSLTVTLDASSLDLGASNSTTLDGTVSYADTAPAIPGAGSTDGVITLLVSVPDGWSATLEPSSEFSLAPGQSAPFTLVLTAPAEATGAATGEASVTGSSTSSGGRTASATAVVALTRVDPPPVVIPWYQTTLGILGIVGAVLLVVGIVAGVVWSRRRTRLAAEAAAAAHAAFMDRETGITVAVAGGPIQYGHRREIMYRVSVTNASKRPRVALVDVVEVSNGWRAATQVAKLPLSVGETQAVTLVVTPDAVITPGDRARVVVRAKPEEARERDERVVVDVVAPKHGVPQDPNYRIVSVHREGAGSIPLKR